MRCCRGLLLRPQPRLGKRIPDRPVVYRAQEYRALRAFGFTRFRIACSDTPKRLAASCTVTLSRSIVRNPVPLASVPYPGVSHTPVQPLAGRETATSRSSWSVSDFSERVGEVALPCGRRGASKPAVYYLLPHTDPVARLEPCRRWWGGIPYPHDASPAGKPPRPTPSARFCRKPRALSNVAFMFLLSSLSRLDNEIDHGGGLHVWVRLPAAGRAGGARRNGPRL